MKTAWKVAVFVLAAMCLLWIVGSSLSFGSCISQQSPLHAGALGWIRVQVGCAGDFTDKNKDTIAALAAAFIAAFTFTLWTATKRLWKSAEEQLSEFRRSLEQAKAIADQQGIHLLGSVNEAARSARAMEQVATSISSNVETTTEMAQTQREFGQLQMRAYLTANYGLCHRTTPPAGTPKYD